MTNSSGKEILTGTKEEMEQEIAKIKKGEPASAIWELDVLPFEDDAPPEKGMMKNSAVQFFIGFTMTLGVVWGHYMDWPQSALYMTIFFVTGAYLYRQGK